jgi:hypothetical protein
MNLTTGKELANLVLANPADVRVLRIIDKEVVPEDKSSWFKDTKHLLRNSLSYLLIENRSKNGGL